MFFVFKNRTQAIFLFFKEEKTNGLAELFLMSFADIYDMIVQGDFYYEKTDFTFYFAVYLFYIIFLCKWNGFCYWQKEALCKF